MKVRDREGERKKVGEERRKRGRGKREGDTAAKLYRGCMISSVSYVVLLTYSIFMP